MVQRLPQSRAPISDVHRFWEQTGSFYVRGMGNDNLTDPFIGLGVMPASSALFRDLTAIRFEHPVWIGENCTACGKCYTVCSTGKVEAALQELKKEYTIVLVPHSVQQAGRAADYAAFFLQGELIEYGEGKSLFTAPKQKRTEDYITGRFG